MHLCSQLRGACPTCTERVEAFILKMSLETEALFYKSIIYQPISYNHLENKIVLTVSRLTFKRIWLTSSAHTRPRRATQNKSPEFKRGWKSDGVLTEVSRSFQMEICAAWLRLFILRLSSFAWFTVQINPPVLAFFDWPAFRKLQLSAQHKPLNESLASPWVTEWSLMGRDHSEIYSHQSEVRICHNCICI